MSRLLDQALELDAAGRQRWLEQLAPEHRDIEPALRWALLGEAVLGTLPRVGVQGAVSGLRPGDLLGPYRLVRPLGEGGMAEVWLAERADGAFKRELAVKLPKLGGQRQDLASRFARERDILAALEHPNIARLYDAGVSEQKLPYLAMEYVAGQPLVAWCDAHRLTVVERLKLFLQVLEAVNYAHEHQVVHRDIKPSNILVTESGQVRLLDFGVAKLLERSEGTELTQVYGRALTPEYASPEQLKGETAEAASDVYALGVVLYELLCGSRPYSLRSSSSVDQLQQDIAAVQVSAPSLHLGTDAGAARGTADARLLHLLRGDLDAIVLKAMAKGAQDRYPSAKDLADDLQHYLSTEPVAAVPSTPANRLIHFLKRNRIAVATSAAAVLIAVLGTYTLSNRSPGPAAQKSGPLIAVNEKSIAVLPFVDMSEKHDQEYFSDGLSEELIDQLSRIPDLKVIARTSAFSFKGKNEDIRTIASKLGVAHLLEGSVRKAGNDLRITAQLIRAADGSHLWSQTFERRLADVFKVQDEIAAAVVKAFKLSLLEGSPPKASRTRNIEAFELTMLAQSTRERAVSKEDRARAVRYVERALKLDPTYAFGWAELSAQRTAQAISGDISDQGYEDARQAADRAVSLDPNFPAGYNARAYIYLFHDWNWGAAEAQVAKAFAIDPKRAGTLDQRRSLYWVLGDLAKAAQLAVESIEVDPLDPGAHVQLGYIHFAEGRLAEARAAFEAALDLEPKMPGGHQGLALILAAEGNPAAALVEIDRETDDQIRLWTRAYVYFELGRKKDADSALAEYEAKYAGLDPTGIAELRAVRGETDEAFKWLDRAYSQRDSGCTFVKTDVFLHSLKPDPRFKAFLRKMKLPE